MSEDAIAVFIPIVAIIMSLSIPIVFAIIDYRRRRDIVEAHHKERMAAIERGMDLPPLPEAFFKSFSTDRKPRHLLTGMIWTFVGLGLFVALREVAGRRRRLVRADADRRRPRVPDLLLRRRSQAADAARPGHQALTRASSAKSTLRSCRPTTAHDSGRRSATTHSSAIAAAPH